MEELQEVFDTIDELKEREVDFLKLIGSIEKSLDYSKELEEINGSLQGKLDLAIEDLVHYAERLEKPKSYQSNKYFKALGVIRRKRRDIKNLQKKCYIYKKHMDKCKGFIANIKNELILEKKNNNRYHTRILKYELGEII